MQKPAPSAIAADAVLAPGGGRTSIGALLPSLRAPLRRVLGWASRGIGSIADQAASGAITFLVSLLIGRFIGADGLGLFAVTNVAFLFIASLYNGALLEPFSVFAPRRTEGERAAYRGFIARGAAAVIAGMSIPVALALASWSLAATPGAGTLFAFAGAGLSANVLLVQLVLRRHFYIEGQVPQAAAQSLACLILVAAALTLYVCAADASVAGVYVVLAGASAVVCAVQMPRFFRMSAAPTPAQARTFAAEHWQYGRWVLATAPLYVGAVQGYYLIAALLLPAEEVGYLKAAETMIGPFGQVAMGLTMLLLPLTARHMDRMSAGQRRRTLWKALGLFAGLGLAYAAALAGFGDLLLQLAFGPAIAAGATPLITLIAAVPVLWGAAITAGMVLAAMRRPEIVFASYLLAAMVMVSAGSLLMAACGITGAIIGLLASWLTLAATQLAAAWWISGERRADRTAPGRKDR